MPGDAATPARVAADDAGPELRRYVTPYYLIYTDLDEPLAAEAVVRLKVLGEVYRRRTRDLGLTGRIEARLPAFLFKNRQHYLNTGAPPESAGAFLGDRLVAAATDRAGRPAWHVIQHEAFHQFAAAVKGPELPGWLNEGLGEYFGESIFTGDGYVTDVIPAWRAARVKKQIEAGAFKPVDELLRMTQDDWNKKVVLARYDQAWSIVQYILLSHPEGRHHLAGCVKEILAGESSEKVVARQFGDMERFQAGWREFWLAEPDPTWVPRWQVKASVATATSFLARATAHGRRFTTFADFFTAYRVGEFRLPPDDWLPTGMLLAAVGALPPETQWKLEHDGDLPRITVMMPSKAGREFRGAGGSFKLRDGKVEEVTAGEMIP